MLLYGKGIAAVTLVPTHAERKFYHLRLLRNNLERLYWKDVKRTRDGDSTTSLGNMCNLSQCSVTLTGTLLAHVQLGVHQNPQVLLCKTALQLGDPQHVLDHGAVPSLVQDFALLLVEFREVSVIPFLQPVEVLLDGSMTLWCISCSAQFCITSKIIEGTLCPIIKIINEDVEQD
ncbi:hypothetical protein QYF61_027732 [Mycteria americana]|uniref:Uncharacterized protein n=1 Tax=Mycteria americana TaxID=33587 RepID=A0AAN7NWF4_MYCAM|nr:hypothetical protein QYF61_027732 [Mycteria americana]